MPVPMPPAEEPRRVLLRDEVHARLLDAIIDGTLAPGEYLRDADLAQWLQTSRTPIREALGRLEMVGLIELVPHRFTRVTELDPQMVQDSLETLVFLAGGSFLELPERIPHAELRSLPLAFNDPGECIDHFWGLTLSILGAPENHVLLHSTAALHPVLGRAFNHGAAHIDTARYRGLIHEYLGAGAPNAFEAITMYRRLGQTLLEGCHFALEQQTFVTDM